MATAQIHRFRDKVAAYLGTGELVYLTADEAEALAHALLNCSEDVRDRSFTASAFVTEEFKFDGGRN